jgi:uncharacterized membrane protein
VQAAVAMPVSRADEQDAAAGRHPMRMIAPARRGGRADPDFEFPQDARQRAGWSPRLSDYLYVSLTNAIAVSPTDTMPLTRRAKGLVAVESLISYAVVILVVARAVIVLGAGG